MLEIKVSIRTVFGNDTVYPICDTAQRFAMLTGRKTLTPRDLQIIRLLGYTVTVLGPGVPEWIRRLNETG